MKQSEDEIMELVYRGCTIHIVADLHTDMAEYFETDEAFIVAFHNQFAVSHEGITEGLIQSMLDGNKYEDGSKNYEAVETSRKYHLFILEAYIHSGVRLYLFNGKKKDAWDSSILGAVLVSKEDWKMRTEAKGIACGLVESWNQYLSGEVYGFVVEDKEGEEFDSCYGFLGDPEESGLMDNARSAVDIFITQEKKAHAEVLKAQIKNNAPLESRKRLKV